MSEAKTAIKTLNGHPLKDSEARERIEQLSAKRGLPRVYIDGEIPTTKNDTFATLTYRDGRRSWQAYLRMKCQGNSSMSYPKKNFTIKMFEDENRSSKKKVAFDIFGSEKRDKYVLKANYIDHLHARNIISARLWSEVVASRPDYSTLPAEMRGSSCNGAIDGFPVLLYANGKYEGIYTWNIAKDDAMWGMDEDNPNHVLLCAETNDNNDQSLMENACNFRALWSGTDGDKWSVEVGTNSEALKTSLNALISCVKDAEEANFKTQIQTYLDVQAAIDYYIFAYAICGIDNLAKNMLLATYDGVKWIPGMYDMDSTWGLFWNGSKFVSATTACPDGYQNTKSLLWERINRAFETEIQQRKKALRSTVLSDANILQHFEAFAEEIGRDAYADDLVPYPDIPQSTTNNIWQIRNFVNQRMHFFDGWLADHTLFKLNAPLIVNGEASNAVNTGVKLFAEDMDFSIAIDATATEWDNSKQSLFECHNRYSPWQGLSIIRHSAWSTKYLVRTVFANGTKDATTNINANSTSRFIVVIRHIAGTGKFEVTSFTGGQEATYEIENPFTESFTYNLWIGCAEGDWDAKNAFGGTINRCIISGKYLSDSEVSAFIAEGTE